ncbi:hypothetical protein LJC26_00205 [Desulfovibrio sp. OttesenSCG-928-O18]|nr:hypothetical protein [Desulfovibrio sp. OttesenSCG-928-O18]
MAEKTAKSTESEKNPGRLVPVLILSCALNAALGLGLVLVSIERTELGYSARKLEGQVRVKTDHANELEVERGRLLSPYALEQKAAQFGMRAAKPGQIRRMGNATLDTLPR